MIADCFTILKKEIRLQVREKEGLIISSFMGIMIMFFMGLAFSGGQTRFSVGFVDLDGAELAQEIYERMDSSDIFLVERVDNSTAFEGLRRGDYRCILLVPQQFSANVSRLLNATLVLIVDDSDIQAASNTEAAVMGFLQKVEDEIAAERNQQNIEFITEKVGGWSHLFPMLMNLSLDDIVGYISTSSQPIRVDYEASVHEITRPLDFLFPGILCMMIMWNGLIAGFLSIAEEKEKGAFHRLVQAPISGWSLFSAKMLSSATFSLIVTTVIFTVGKLVFGAKSTGSPILVVAILLLATATMVSLGMLFAPLFKSTKMGQSLAILIAMPMQFFVGIFFPLELMSPIPRAIGSHFPLYFSVRSLRQVMLNNAPLSEIWPDILVLLGFTVVFLVLGVLIHTVTLRRT